MRFLIIVLCLLSERYLTHEYQQLRKTWLNHYTHFLQTYIPKNIYNQTPLMPYFISLGSLVAIALLFGAMVHWNVGLILNFVFELAVFYICLGGHNLFYSDSDEKTPLRTNQYIQSMNEEVFAIILWFFILGPIGALTYRTTTYFLSVNTQDELLKKLHAILDWAPVRVSSLLFLMVGQFQPGFAYFIQNISKTPEFNHKLLIHTTRNALGVNEKEYVEPMQLENLYTHASLLFVFILAIYVIGKFL